MLLLLCVTGSPALHAQAAARNSGPRIGYVYPAGGKQGTTFTLTIGGQFLGDVTRAEFFGGGVEARLVGSQHPLNQKEQEELKTEGEALRQKFRDSRKPGGGPEKVVWRPEDEKRAAELRAMGGYRMNRQTAPAICEAVTFEVTLAPDAKPGEHEVRLRGPNGLSNPLVFHVGTLAEFSEPAAHPNTAAPDAKGGGNNDAPVRPKPAPSEHTLTLPGVANGQILPGEVDRWRFTAKRGQKVVVAVSARALLPYLADAVPGWFQATVALRDASGHELAYDDDFRFSPDPVLCREIRADGEYVVEIKDSIYRGRQDFVYRIAIGELPFVTSAFPLGGPIGRATTVALSGWNLPVGQGALDGRDRAAGSATLAVNGPLSRSNAIPLALGADPEIAEAPANDSAANAQALTLPVTVNGRIERAGDEDWFSVVGRPGADVVAEVFARRLNSPLDSLLVVQDAAGGELARNDDSEDKGSGLTTHHADSRVQFKLPADGRCTIRLADTQHQGGAEFAYRLQVHEARPDFALRVVPSSINVRPGTHVPVTVFALRHDGYTGPIELGLRNAEGVFKLSGAVIPAGQDRVRVTLTTLAAPRDEAFHPEFVGRATIGGAKFEHTAVPCEDQMQAFAYRHLVPVQELEVAVVGRAVGPRVVMRVEDGLPVKLVAGAESRVRVTVPVGKFFERLKVEANEFPEGVALARSSWSGDTVELVFTLDAAKAKPGLRGNLLLQLTGERAGAPNDDQAKKANRARIPLSFLPALPFEILAAAEAKSPGEGAAHSTL